MFKHLELIATDEISVGKNHRYLTVVLALLSGAVVYVGDGKDADALLPFWRKLKRSSASIVAVAMDMSPAFIASVTEHLPKATIVFDHVPFAYYNYRISTGPLEGTNKKIKTLQRQAYGFRDMQFFRFKIFGLHETKYTLVG